jgi:hypothetical protein
MCLPLRTDADDFNEDFRELFIPANYGRRIGWAIEARMATHCNFSPAIMTEGLLGHPAVHIDNRMNDMEDIAICWENGTLDRVDGENILLLLKEGNNISFDSPRNSSADDGRHSSGASSLVANEPVPAPRVARAPDMVDLTLDDTTDEILEAKPSPDDTNTSAAEDSLENAIICDARKNPVASDNVSDETIIPKLAFGSGADIVDSEVNENPDVADPGIGENLSSPGDSNGYAADSDCLMSFDFFENVMHDTQRNRSPQNLMYDACDEYSQMSMEFTEETAMMTAVMDKEVAGLKALLIALKEREK